MYDLILSSYKKKWASMEKKAMHHKNPRVKRPYLICSRSLSISCNQTFESFMQQKIEIKKKLTQ